MRRCVDCRIILDDNVRYCPKCGNEIALDDSSAQSSASDVQLLLRSASLHRSREDWERAIADATDALRLDPRNPDVPSLLGDIYEKQGMRDEAIAWYQMALEMNPDSSADKEHLERLSELILEEGRHKRSESHNTLQSRTKTWGWALGSVFIVIIILAAISISRGRSVESTMNPPVPTARPHYGTAAPVTPPTQALPPGPSTPSDVSAASSAGGSVRTPGELYIRSELAGSQDITAAGAAVNDLIADPRSGVVSVTFTVRFTPHLSKDNIITAAAVIARNTFELNREVKFVTARCLVEIGGAQGTQIAFVGDVARQSIESISPTATTEQIAAIFTTPWWNPQIK